MLYDLSPIFKPYGEMRCIVRARLLELLASALPAETLTMNCSVTSLRQVGEEVEVQFSDGAREVFDLVVGCDGIRSSTRQMLFGEVPVCYSGWAAWAWWPDPSLVPTDTCIEYWAPMPRTFGLQEPVEGRVGRIRSLFGERGGLMPLLLKHLPDSGDILYVEFSDIKLPEWGQGRVMLVGDSGHAILPNSGVGASMAMESAAVLADELSRADRGTVPAALDFFKRRRRKRVNRVQAESRLLAKLTFLDSKFLSFGRDEVLKYFSKELLASSFNSILEGAHLGERGRSLKIHPRFLAGLAMPRSGLSPLCPLKGTPTSLGAGPVPVGEPALRVGPLTLVIAWPAPLRLATAWRPLCGPPGRDPHHKGDVDSPCRPKF